MFIVMCYWLTSGILITKVLLPSNAYGMLVKMTLANPAAVVIEPDSEFEVKLLGKIVAIFYS